MYKNITLLSVIMLALGSVTSYGMHFPHPIPSISYDSAPSITYGQETLVGFDDPILVAIFKYLISLNLQNRIGSSQVLSHQWFFKDCLSNTYTADQVIYAFNQLLQTARPDSPERITYGSVGH